MSAVTKIVQAGNGQEMFAGRVAAWDGLGQVSDKVIPAKDWNKFQNMANLNFTFHYSPVFDDLGNEVPKSRVVYREVQGGAQDGTRVHSGIVGDRHHQLQPGELFEAASIANKAGEFITAGLLKNSRMWIQMTGDKEFVLDPGGVADRVLNFSTFSTTFDGSGSLIIGDTNLRWNCANVITADIRGTKWEYRIRHTASAKDRLSAAVEAIADSRSHNVKFQALAKELFETPFTTKQFENAVVSLNGARPEDNVKGRETKWENMMESHMGFWNGAHNAGIRETAWGAWQVLMEENQWGRNIQNTPNGEANFWAAGMGFDGPTNSYRQDSLALVAARAGVSLKA